MFEYQSVVSLRRQGNLLSLWLLLTKAFLHHDHTDVSCYTRGFTGRPTDPGVWKTEDTHGHFTAGITIHGLRRKIVVCFFNNTSKLNLLENCNFCIISHIPCHINWTFSWNFTRQSNMWLYQDSIYSLEFNLSWSTI